MTAPTLVATACAIVVTGKGLLAMDERNPTCNKLRCARHCAV
jgi:hypothetical protein